MPISSIGASLFILIPSAFVALPTAPMQALSARAKLRVISAGSFHNLILWIFLMSYSWLALGRSVWTTIGYDDIGHYGRVVISVDQVFELIVQREPNILTRRGNHAHCRLLPFAISYQ